LRFSLSYRDLEELVAERGLHADLAKVWRSRPAKIEMPAKLKVDLTVRRGSSGI
jgi:transposase-like protein